MTEEAIQAFEDAIEDGVNIWSQEDMKEWALASYRGYAIRQYLDIPSVPYQTKVIEFFGLPPIKRLP